MSSAPAVNSGQAAPKEARETWTNKIDFLLACIGFSVGLGNVWRFPYLCYKNGGGAFMIPYMICVVIGGIPLFFLEVALGQFMSCGGVYAWKLCPILQGIGWATTVIMFFVNCYYNVILAWAFYYFFASLTTELPWISCDNYWNTPQCVNDFDKNTTKDIVGAPVDPTTEFWERKVLGLTDGLETPGKLKWDLVMCLLCAWVVVFLCICKGIKTSGKVMYVTATSPYIFMTILLIRGAMLEGSVQGILFYLVPDFSKLSQMTVWVDAGTQIFFSYSISLGALTALGSYNKFHHNSYRDSIIFACTNSGTSIFAGFVIFCTLGHMAHLQDVTVDKVAAGGPGLAFIAYPKVVSQMPIAPLWSAIFFLMIILLGLDSQFVGVEALVTAFVDTFPALRQRGKRQIFIGGACVVQFLIGLSMVTEGGMYVFQLFDYYSGSKIILFVAFFECIAIAYIYGIERFYQNLEMMFGYRINPYMKVSWLFGAPVFCMSIFIMSVIDYQELTYERPNHPIYVYPQWGVGVGWAIAGLSAVCIPLFAVYKIIRYLAFENKTCLDLFRPEHLEPHQLRPEDKTQLGVSDPDIPMIYDADTYDVKPPSYKVTYDNTAYTHEPGADF